MPVVRNNNLAGLNVIMLKVDLHIHSIASGHAYATIYEIIMEAKRKQMEMIAITDHGFVDPEDPMNNHFLMGSRKPDTGDLEFLWGAEANLLNEMGKTDLPEKALERLDLVSIGLHIFPKTDMGRDGNTRGLMKALENPKVKILAHPTQGAVPCDAGKVMEKAVAEDVLLELNLSKLANVERKGQGSLNEFKQIVDLVKDKGKKLIVGSDAHFLHEIGDDSVLKKHWGELGLEEELIINNYPGELRDFLGLKE